MQSLGMESSIIMLNFPALQGWHMLAHVGTCWHMLALLANQSRFCSCFQKAASMYMINTGFDLTVRLRMIVERVSQSLTFPVAAYEQAREGCPRFGLVGSVLQEQK